MKTCIKCNINKDLKEFYFDKTHNIHRTDCKVCVKNSNSKYQKEHRKINRLATKKYRQKNPNKNKEYYKKHYNLNKQYYIEKDAKRRALKLNARPKWVNIIEMKKIYNNCPKEFHVDHIIPLKHSLVCGLDVP